MGTFIKLLILLVIIALAAPFFIKGQDGRPLMTLEDIKKPDSLENYAESLGKMGDSVSGVAKDSSSKSPESPAKVYSWRDEQGNVHYSNVPPKEAAAVETVKVNPNVNVISVDKTNEQARLPVPAPQTDDTSGESPKIYRTYTPEPTSR